MAKIKEDVSEVELDNPSAPAGNPAPVALRVETQAAPASAKPKRSRRTLIMLAVPLLLAAGGTTSSW